MVTVGELNRDPEFQKLSYEDQVKVRRDIFATNLSKDPEFLSLGQATRVKVLHDIVYQPPAMSSPEAQAGVDALAKGIRAGDETAIQTGKRELMLATMGKASLIANVVDRALVSPFLESMEAGPTERWDHADILRDPERAKIINYLDLELNRSGAVGQKFNTMRTVFGGALTLTEFVGMALVGAGTTFAPRALGKLFTAPTASIVGNAAKMATLSGLKRTGLRTAQSILHAGATTSMGVARELAQDTLNKVAEEPGGRAMMEKTLKWAGGYFLGDIVWNIAADIMLPMVGSSAKVFLGKTLPKKALTYQEQLVRALSGSDLDDAIVATYTKAQQEEIVKAQALSKTLANVEKLDDVDALSLVTDSFGGTLLVDGKLFNALEKNVARQALVNKKVSLVIRMPDARGSLRRATINGLDARGISDTLVRRMDMLKKTATAAATAGKVAGASDFFVGRKISKVELDGIPENPATLLARTIQPVNGKYTAEQVDAFVKVSLKASGAADEVIDGIEVAARNGFIEVRSKGKFVTKIFDSVEGPSLEAETETLMGILDGVKKLSGGLDEVEVQRLRNAVLKEIPTHRVMTPGYIDEVAQKKLGASLYSEGDDYFELMYANGEKQVFRSFREVGDFVLSKTYELPDVAAYAKEQFGYAVKVGKKTGEVIVYNSRGGIVRQAPTLDELLTELPFLQPKVSGKVGPQMTLVDGKIQLHYVEGLATGGKTRLMQFLNSFKEPELKYTTINSGGAKMKVNLVSKQIELEVPGMSYRQKFDDIAEARKFMKGWNEYDAVAHMAYRKGHRIEYRDGLWYAYTKGQAPRTAKRLGEIKSYLAREAPIPEWAPELTGLSDDLLASVKVPKGEGFAEQIFGDGAAVEPDYSIKTMIASWLTPTGTHLEKMVLEGGNPDIIRHYRNVEAMRNFIKGQASEFGKLIDSAFVDASGKRMKAKAVKRVQMYLATGGDVEKLKALGLDGIKFTDDEVRAAGRVRELFGTSHMEGLSAHFGVTFEQWQREYLPRVFEKQMKNPVHRSTAAAMLDAAFEGEQRSKMGAFFKHARRAELEQVASAKDIRQSLMGYYNLGMREKYLGPMLDSANEVLKASDPMLSHRYAVYLSQLGGVPQGWSEETIRKISQKVFQSMGLDAPASADISRALMGWGYTSALGLRPALVIRNMNQIWTMLDPILGGRYTRDALKAVSKDNGELFEKLRRLDVVRNEIPLYGAETLTKETPAGKVIHTALRWYQSSDDFTRAVAYLAGERRFLDGVEAFKKNPQMDLKQFTQATGLHRMPIDLQEKILQSVDQGRFAGSEAVAISKYQGAAHLYASEIVNQTMFKYSVGNGSMAFRGTMGRVFGMFGTYPLYYVENIRRTLNSASVSEVMGFAGRFLANTAALYGAFSAFGIRMDAFKPWNPMLFTGGPFYEMSNKIMQAATGDQRAFNSLVGLRAGGFSPLDSELLQWGLPFGFAVNDLADGVKAYQDGDIYGALLNATGFSLFDDGDEPLQEFFRL